MTRELGRMSSPIGKKPKEPGFFKELIKRMINLMIDSIDMNFAYTVAVVQLGKYHQTLCCHYLLEMYGGCLPSAVHI